MKKVIIAEKPSLAKNIIAAIGMSRFQRADGYFESEDYVVTWAFGHLFSLIDIEEYDSGYLPDEAKHWSFDDIPFCPERFRFSLKKDIKTKKTDKGVSSQFSIIKKLINRRDVDAVINAGDADREGEIIIRIILENAENKKPVYRLWMPDQTPSTINSELKRMKSDKQYDNLADEGYARTYIDWLYGINLTRYATLMTGKLLRVGRVTSPIIKAIYDREMEIRNFKSEKYFKVISTEKTKGEEIELISKNEFDKDSEHLANALCLRYNALPTKVVDVKTEEVSISPGKLFSLSKLQGEVGKQLKLSPQETLTAVQGLYEAGYVTYPRTNTEYMAVAEKGKVQAIINEIKTKMGANIKFKDTKKIFDDTKIESHSAITPTTKMPNPKTLSQRESDVYKIILQRFCAVFSAEDFTVDRTTIKIDNTQEIFTLTGDIIKNKGWTVFEKNTKTDKVLPKLSVGDEVKVNFKAVEKETQPPKHYTTQTFNSFLKNPFKDENDKNENDDEEYKAIMNGAELGTEATRAGLIDAAVRSGYITFDKNIYGITKLGEYYVQSLTALFIDMSKEKTVQLGMSLKNVYKNKITINDSVKFAFEEIQNTVLKKEQVKLVSAENLEEVFCKCPKCGSAIRENAKAYSCINKNCGVVIFKKDKFFERFNKKMTSRIAKALFEKGQAKVKGFTSPKSGKSFDAIVHVEFKDKYPSYEFEFITNANK